MGVIYSLRKEMIVFFSYPCLCLIVGGSKRLGGPSGRFRLKKYIFLYSIGVFHCQILLKLGGWLAGWVIMKQFIYFEGAEKVLSTPSINSAQRII